MKSRPRITRIELVQFEHQLKDTGREPTIGIPIYEPGSSLAATANAIRVHTDAGVTGEYVGGHATEYAGIPGMAPSLIGRGALGREEIYNDYKQATRQQARMGLGIVDIALWDLAGKFFDAPVYELLGGSQRKLPCYASTYIGDHDPNGLSQTGA